MLVEDPTLSADGLLDKQTSDGLMLTLTNVVVPLPPPVIQSAAVSVPLRLREWRHLAGHALGVGCSRQTHHRHPEEVD